MRYTRAMGAEWAEPDRRDPRYQDRPQNAHVHDVVVADTKRLRTARRPAATRWPSASRSIRCYGRGWSTDRQASEAAPRSLDFVLRLVDVGQRLRQPPRRSRPWHRPCARDGRRRDAHQFSLIGSMALPVPGTADGRSHAAPRELARRIRNAAQTGFTRLFYAPQGDSHNRPARPAFP